MKTYQTIQELESIGIVTAGITLRHGGVSCGPYTSLNLAEHVGDDANAVATNREIFSQHSGLSDLHYCRQIHSDRVIEANCKANTTSKQHPEADALVSAQYGVPLGIFTADCIPIFILDVATPAIGIAHAGWRGTLARIAVNTLAMMQNRFGTLTTNCKVHLGPSIQKCCYIVSTELIEQFTEQFGNTVHQDRNLSLQTANVNQLIEIDVPAASISVSPFCTACRTDLFYSHRAEAGQTGRMLSYIQLDTKN